jgi:hypothetical protein
MEGAVQIVATVFDLGSLIKENIGLVIAAALIIGVPVGFSFLMFLTALWEKRHIRRLAPLPQDRVDKVPPKSFERVIELQEDGLQDLGLFTDGDKGIMEGIVSVMIAPAGDVVAYVIHSKLNRRVRFYTRLADTRWIITSDMTTTTDLSGLQDQEMLPNVPPSVLLKYHRDRLYDVKDSIDPFDPVTVIEDFYARDYEVADKLEELGYIHYLTPDRDVYRHTAAGAWRISTHFLRSTGKIDEQTKRAKARKKAWQAKHG